MITLLDRYSLLDELRREVRARGVSYLELQRLLRTGDHVRILTSDRDPRLFPKSHAPSFDRVILWARLLGYQFKVTIEERTDERRRDREVERRRCQEPAHAGHQG